MAEVLIRKVREPFGCLGNMSPHSIQILHYDIWPTAEHFFQALRFSNLSPVREEIRMQIGPMQAKFVAKKYKHLMEVVPRSAQDLFNMKFVLLCKWEEHQVVRDTLESTGDAQIIEDCSNRPNESGLFWGARLRYPTEPGPNPGMRYWEGENVLGKLWMEIRDMKRSKQ